MENKGRDYLACEGESVKEVLSELAPLKGRLILRYHKGSERMSMTGKDGKLIDCRLWDVLSPRVPGYVYNSDSHIPTFSVEGLRQRGLLK